MENKELNILHYDITIVSSLNFLQIYNSYFHFDKEIYLLSLYFLELSNLEYKLLKYYPSLLASSAILISLKIYNSSKEKMKTFLCFTQYNYDQVFECMKDIYNILYKFQLCEFNSTYIKFCSEKFDYICKDKKWESFNLLVYDDL